jgi:2-polyprenyl-3-methyl-5-hydroxy-6-metoxy-1,4-benzoquinol methylase
MTAETAGSPDSWKSFFAHPEYTRFAGSVVPPERTRAEVEQIIDLLGLHPGARILDLGCGNGRIAIPLAEAGYSVTGLDACESLAAIARKSAADRGTQLSVIHAEMQDFSLEGQFDAVINIGTAFGYVARSEDDRAALRNVYQSLVPGGKFLLETENRDHRVRTGQRVWFELAGTMVWCDRRYDPMSARWHERIEWLADGKREGVEYSLRLYTLAELAAMLDDAGFAVTGAWGGLSQPEYDLDSPRTVVMARRPHPAQ